MMASASLVSKVTLPSNTKYYGQKKNHVKFVIYIIIFFYKFSYSMEVSNIWIIKLLESIFRFSV